MHETVCAQENWKMSELKESDQNEAGREEVCPTPETFIRAPMVCPSKV